MKHESTSPGSSGSQPVYESESYEIIGACIEVHRRLGPGFLEPVYQGALEIELAHRRIPFAAQETIPIHYRDRLLEAEYKADFVCYDKIILEIKSLGRLTGREFAQTLNYLKATEYRLGLLVNFGSHGVLERNRIVL